LGLSPVGLGPLAVRKPSGRERVLRAVLPAPEPSGRERVLRAVLPAPVCALGA